MSKLNKNTPYTPYGPATGIPTPEESKGTQTSDSHYTGASTPGTANNAQPGHISGGPGHGECDHE